MKVIFNSKEKELLEDILKETKHHSWISRVEVGKEVEVDEDKADEIRELCEDIEVGEALKAETKRNISNKGKIACDLVDKLFI